MTLIQKKNVLAALKTYETLQRRLAEHEKNEGNLEKAFDTTFQADIAARNFATFLELVNIPDGEARI